MKSYTLTQTRNQHGEVFDKATVEPILITKQKRPSHVILSAQTYQQLISRLEDLEDLHLAQATKTALDSSLMIGSKEFTSALEEIANA